MGALNVPSRVQLLPILTVNFVGTLGFGIVLPFLVYLVTRLGGNAVIYGVLGATYSLFQLVGAPILGRWSDRMGRRRILLLSQIGTLVSWGIFLIALAIPARPMVTVNSAALGVFTLTVPLVVLFLARALDGLTGGNVSVANAYLADITPESERGAAFGKMSVASNLGFIMGPALAGVLGATALGETLPVMAAFVISVVGTVIIAVRLPESNPCVLLQEPESTSVAVSDRTLLLLGSAILAVSFAFFASIRTATLYAGAALLAVGNGLMWPSLLSILSKAARPSIQGAVQGIAGSSSAVASIVGLLVGGVLYGLLGGLVFPIATAVTAGVFLMALLTGTGSRTMTTSTAHD
ncbi:MAG TPA: MFS transporter [Gemmatimonadales bacterium]